MSRRQRLFLAIIVAIVVLQSVDENVLAGKYEGVARMLRLSNVVDRNPVIVGNSAEVDVEIEKPFLTGARSDRTSDKKAGCNEREERVGGLFLN